jgi:hypothetical protein
LVAATTGDAATAIRNCAKRFGKVLSDQTTVTGQKAKYSLKADVFRFTPESGLKSDIGPCPFGAPQADIEPSRAEAKKLQPTSMSTVRFEPIVADLTSTLGLAECVLKNDFVTSEGKKVASSRRDRLSARISRHKVPLE